jgi:hypothetical protein
MILKWSKKLICDLIHKSSFAIPYNKLQFKSKNQSPDFLQKYQYLSECY